MPRYHLTLEYDGGPFVGWQRQDNGPSVQEALEDAALKFTQKKAATVAAGRTDAGVHARAMSVHIDLHQEHDPHVIRNALNQHLKPAPIAVMTVALAPTDFHARFSATARHYEYLMVNRRAPLALDRGRAWRISNPMDADAMHHAAQFLVGRHDFTTFRAAQCQAASPVKTLSSVGVRREGDVIRLTIGAPSFLHHQVRSIAGSLAQVGIGRWPTTQIKIALDARDRAACGQVAPAHGLYFLRADYPGHR